MAEPAAPLRLNKLFDGTHADAGALEAVMAHPRFPEAMQLAMQGWVDMMVGNRLINTVMTDRARLLLSLFAVLLHLEARPDDPATGLTAGRLKAALAPHNLASPGRIDAMLALMRLLGYLEAVPQTGDRRVRQLQPTQKLLELHRRRTDFSLQSAALVLSDGEDGLRALNDQRFLPAMLAHLAVGFLRGYFIVDLVPDMRPVLEHNGGLPAMLSLMLGGRRGDTFPPRQPVQLSISGLARRFGVSRAQMRRVFVQATDVGLVARAEDGEAWHILPRLEDALRRLTAHYLIQHAQAVRTALGAPESGGQA